MAEAGGGSWWRKLAAEASGGSWRWKLAAEEEEDETGGVNDDDMVILMT